MAISKVHHCSGQIKVAEEKIEPPAPRCRCRKYVSIRVATQMVKNGEASWVVLTRKSVPVMEVCSLCHGDPEVKKCANCEGRGKVPGTEVIETEGEDIVLVSRLPADKKEKKRSSALAAKTPRVATIEEEHIELAYVYGVKEAAERIKEYGLMTKEELAFSGKAIYPCVIGDCPFRRPDSPEQHNHGFFAIKNEPTDDRATGTGRRYDYGRTI